MKVENEICSDECVVKPNQVVLEFKLARKAGRMGAMEK